MTITMDDSTLINITAVEQFLKLADNHQFRKKDRGEAYQWMETILVKFHYMA